MEAEVGHRGVHVGAHEAVRAVAADDVGGAQGPLFLCVRLAARSLIPGVRGDGQLYSGLVFGEVHGLPASQDLDAGQGAGAVLQGGFEARLGEDALDRPAGMAGVFERQADQGLSLAVAPLVVLGGLGDVAQDVAEVQGCQDAGDLVVEDDRAGQRVPLRPALHDTDPPAPHTELDGRGEPGGPRADDQHVVLVLLGAPIVDREHSGLFPSGLI